MIARRIALAAAAVALVGAAPADRRITRQWLIGYWVPTGEVCSEDSGLHLFASGYWQDADEKGFWRLDRGVLRLTAHEHGLDEGPGQLYDSPRRTVHPLTYLGPNGMRMGGGDRPIEETRCR